MPFDDYFNTTENLLALTLIPENFVHVHCTNKFSFEQLYVDSLKNDNALHKGMTEFRFKEHTYADLFTLKEEFGANRIRPFPHKKVPSYCL